MFYVRRSNLLVHLLLMFNVPIPFRNTSSSSEKISLSLSSPQLVTCQGDDNDINFLRVVTLYHFPVSVDLDASLCAVATVKEPVYPFLFSSSTGNHIGKPCSQCLSVPVFHFFPYGNPYPYLISSSTENNIRSQYLPVPVFYVFQYGKPYSLLISSRTRFSFLLVRETILTLNIFPTLTLTLTLTLPKP